MDQMTVVVLNREQLMDTFGALMELSELMPSVFRKIGGMTEEDIKSCRKDLETGANACIALIAVGDQMHAEHEQQKD